MQPEVELSVCLIQPSHDGAATLVCTAGNSGGFLALVWKRERHVTCCGSDLGAAFGTGSSEEPRGCCRIFLFFCCCCFLAAAVAALQRRKLCEVRCDSDGSLPMTGNGTVVGGDESLALTRCKKWESGSRTGVRVDAATAKLLQEKNKPRLSIASGEDGAEPPHASWSTHYGGYLWSSEDSSRLIKTTFQWSVFAV